MEYQRMINWLDDTTNQPYKFGTKNWVKIFFLFFFIRKIFIRKWASKTPKMPELQFLKALIFLSFTID